MKLRDKFGKFISSVLSTVTGPELDDSPASDETIVESLTGEPVLETRIETSVTINDELIDLTNLTKEQAIILWNYGILNTEHFREMCRLEGWLDTTSDVEYVDDEDEDDDEDY